VRAVTRKVNSGQKRDRQGDLKVDLEAILARGLGRIEAVTTKGMVSYKRGERSHTAAAAAAAAGGRETKVIHLGMIVQAVVGRQKELAEKVSTAIRDSRRADEEEGVTKGWTVTDTAFFLFGFFLVLRFLSAI
jgi:hypothetical protein